jgi:hypothetical protein
MNKQNFPDLKPLDWVEFGWLLVTNPVFRAATNKRKAYFEHRLGKIYTTPCL